MQKERPPLPLPREEDSPRGRTPSDAGGLFLGGLSLLRKCQSITTDELRDMKRADSKEIRVLDSKGSIKNSRLVRQTSIKYY